LLQSGAGRHGRLYVCRRDGATEAVFSQASGRTRSAGVNPLRPEAGHK
jgi:hypothetical protein